MVAADTTDAFAELSLNTAVSSVKAGTEAPMQRQAGELQDGQLFCTICLDNIPLEELATLDVCNHIYCVKCILSWCMERDPCRCPQCKAPFNKLSCHRALDGTMSDLPLTESVCLLKRARWFEDHLKDAQVLTATAPALLEPAFDPEAWQTQEAAPAAGSSPRGNPQGQRSHGELVFDTHGRPSYSTKYSEAFEDDDEVEAFYFSSAAGRLRVCGNRRFGEGGYIASGRKQARAAPAPAARKGDAKGKGKGVAEQGASAPSPCAGKGKGAAAIRTPPGAGTSSSSPDQGESGTGRRARRMAKRAQQDVSAAYD